MPASPSHSGGILDNSRFEIRAFLLGLGIFGADVLDVKPVTLLGRHLDDCSAVKGELIRKVAGVRRRVRLSVGTQYALGESTKCGSTDTLWWFLAVLQTRFVLPRCSESAARKTQHTFLVSSALPLCA